MIQPTAATAPTPMSPPDDDYSPLAYALRYVTLGWAVLPLHTIEGGICSCGDPECRKVAGKHPVASLAPRGLHQATTDPGIVRAWWSTMPDANIGVRTGRVSGFVAVDVDVRGEAGGEETWEALCALHGTPPDTVEAITGSGGRHLLYAYPGEVGQMGNTAGRLGRGIDTRGDGGYIVVEPSRHKSGRTYLWEASSSPLDDIRPAPMPGWMVDALRETKPVMVPGADAPLLVPERVREIRSALAAVPVDDRDVWLRVGMALHAEQPGQQGYGIWTEWSQQSEKFDPRDQQRTWRAFRPDRGVTVNSIFALARDCGWVPVEVPVPEPVREFAAGLGALGSAPAPALVLHSRASETQELPDDLTRPPGVLSDVVAYGLENSIRPIPAFAVQAALALGSVVAARRYVTTKRNYTSLYFLNVARSGTGKEEAKTTIEAILTEAGHRELIGTGRYMSGSAVYSALLERPQHLAIIDEFGRYMEAASGGRDVHRAEALTMLMEVFGRAHASLTTPQFSTMTLRKSHAKDVKSRVISRPAITLLGLTTPDTFYGALSSTRVLDGFLNRILVAEYTGPRIPMRDYHPVGVPLHVVNWIQQLLQPHGNLDLTTRAEQVGDARTVGFTSQALTRSREFERDMLRLANDLDRENLGDMPIRSHEMALRLSLILALSHDAEAPEISGELLDWACRYVTHYLHQTIAALRSRLADSDTERHRNTVLEAIRLAGPRGLTTRELHRTRGIVAIRKHDRDAALESLLTAELVAWTEIPHDGPGRPRHALVALADSSMTA